MNLAAEAPLSVTLAPLIADESGGSIRAALDRVAELDLRFVQLPATAPGLRPRDLDRTARRDLLANLRRRELTLSGLDAWIPLEHFADPARIDRAVSATLSVISLAGDLNRVTVSLWLPSAAEPLQAIVHAAAMADVTLADHALEPCTLESVRAGIDPAALLANGSDPVAAVHAAGRRLASARLVDLLRTGMRGPVGATHEQRLDVESYKVALSVNEYHHPVIIDARQWFDPMRGISASMAAWNRL